MMISPPKTRAEAEASRYGGVPQIAYDPARCAYEQFGCGHFFQCYAKPGKGPDRLYCGIHANKLARDEKKKVGT